MKSNSWLLLAALAAPVACDSGGGDGDTDGGSSTSTTTASTTASTTESPTTSTTPGSSTTDAATTEADGSSSGEPGTGSSTGEPGTGSTSTGEAIQEVSLQFAARVGDAEANCTDTYDAVGSGDDSAVFRDIRFYVSNVRLVNEDGDDVPVELTQDGVWQYEDVALLDFEDGSGACMASGDAGLNTVVVGEVPADTYTGVRFDLGVPAELNHSDANTAEPPLNVLAMSWPWLVGRKFVRIDLSVDTGAVDRGGNPVFNAWNTHLGSQGCSNDGAGGMMPPTMECARPQRPAIALDGFDPEAGTIVADIGALLADNDVSMNMAGAPGCQSFFDTMGQDEDVDCVELFPNYGLSWDSGDCMNDCEDQSFFSVE